MDSCPGSGWELLVGGEAAVSIYKKHGMCKQGPEGRDEKRGEKKQNQGGGTRERVRGGSEGVVRGVVRGGGEGGGGGYWGEGVVQCPSTRNMVCVNGRLRGA